MIVDVYTHFLGNNYNVLTHVEVSIGKNNNPVRQYWSYSYNNNGRDVTNSTSNAKPRKNILLH